jgi:hypothetical protein
MSSVKLSTNLSIIIQVLTGLIGIHGLFIRLPEKHKILQNILTLELIVQFIELFFYIFVLQSMVITALPHMAATRYMDWIITTPTMLLTTIIFFKYEEHLENNNKEKIAANEKIYYEDNKAELNIKTKIWKENNKERIRIKITEHI